MSLRGRLWLSIGGLALIAAVEFGIRSHLSKIGPVTHHQIARPLAEVPLTLAANPAMKLPVERWQGVDHPRLEQLRSVLPYEADDLLFRAYQSSPTAPVVELYMVYSKIGEDRKHHPEICIRDVAGAPEDRGGRKLVALDAEGKRVVQRFRFHMGNAAPITVYYWHYTFPPLPQSGRDWLQTLHLQLRNPSPSLTVQVTSRGSPAELELLERAFLSSIDAALRGAHLSPEVRIGCDRLPIGLNRE